MSAVLKEAIETELATCRNRADVVPGTLESVGDGDLSGT
jgi:hypothetical protein